MFTRATRAWCLAFWLLLYAVPASADVVRVAVASNFAGALKELAAHYEAATGHSVQVSTASTGKHYAQILAGAPFDVFLAADEARPLKLLADGEASASRVYAIGRLVLVSADPVHRGADCRQAFLDSETPTVAIANPAIAPYGKAASEWLATLADAKPMRLVRGENVGQAMSFVVSGNAQFGIVASAQVLPWLDAWPGCAAEIAADSHTPVRQAAALLTRAGEKPAAVAFFEYLYSDAAVATIERWGYATVAKQ